MGTEDRIQGRVAEESNARHMRQWSEQEVFSFLTDHLRQAVADCEALAVNRRRGPTYNHLRIVLEKIEDMCRIVHYMRQDARWLQHGLRCHACHQVAGDWLRGVPQRPGPDGKPRPALAIPEGVKHPLFMKLADYLHEMENQIAVMRNARTNRIGMILPKMLEPPGVRHRPVTVQLPGLGAPLRKTKGGLIIPSGVKMASSG